MVPQPRWPTKDYEMKIIKLLTTVVLLNCLGCVSIASYTFSKNGNFKYTSEQIEARKTEYYLGTRISYEGITAPFASKSYVDELGYRILFVLDYPLTIVADTLFVPFIAIKNIGKD